jgi:hypothetical protein
MPTPSAVSVSRQLLPNYEKLRQPLTKAHIINRERNAPYDDGRNRVTDIGEFARAVPGSAGPSVR